ncbi:putative fructosyl amino acid oxidasesarcosine oxidase protein [Neofusicoccum parvum UCRNP2]|uniref:Putative fructosyl amino acid oxidasesarcosine oxidase protein n=1 Tax=Botryosphaeria parva (strain UCR-NP2) TaxID=1287680 RepID=R1G688_BOTPV|nr:putative fructosyl amino acid oxidasesarcosine oxidase protein [Neofusicoccum parvum UCRNP2]
MDSVLVIGCGVFGLSTGLALAKRYPSSKVTLIDRHEPPVPDGTSVDTTRVIRADYHDHAYSELALESQRLIQKDPELAPHYYRSGMIYAHAGAGRHGSQVWEKEYAAAQALQKQRIASGEFSDQGYLRHLTTHEALYKRVNGEGHEPHEGEKLWNAGYLNEDVAFVNAEECMRVFYHKVRRQPNTDFVFGNPVKRLAVEDGVAKGVELEDGEKLTADLVVLAAGAWSNTLLDLRDQVSSTGHEVAWLKLSPEMEARYKNMPKRWKYKLPEDKDHNMEGAPRAEGEQQELKYCKPIAIVGAGVFGLSTALHLAKSGYKDIT